uniref:Zinc finger domain containing protein n=1 Tax=Haemonchus contortus TaxID=6289 RepID=A0A7I4Z2U9_HAECO
IGDDKEQSESEFTARPCTIAETKLYNDEPLSPLRLEMNHHQPVVVNSLLCFIHNFRGNPQVRNLVAEYFPKTAIAEAKNILCSKVADDTTSSVPEDVFDLYDLLVTREEQMQFAATDLTILPLALLSKDEDKNEIMRELKTLRTFISDALDGRIEDTPQPRETPTPTVRCKLNTSASSPEFPVVHIPATAPCESPKPLLSSSPVNNNVSQQSLQMALAQRQAAVTSPTHSHQSAAVENAKRKAGRSLDATVRKLSEKRKAELEEPPPPPTTVTPYQPPTLDPQAYLNMIRMMQTPQTSIFNSVINQIRMNGQVECENFEDRTDELADDGDSSPSPSEDTKYDFPLTEMSYDNDSDKPFICEHTNCNKRFANKFLLKKHQFIHTGLRPHTCPYCSKRFNRKDNLLRHKKTHLQTSVVEDRRSLPEAFSGLFPAFSSTMGLDLKMDGLDAIKIEPLDAFRVENNED